ncbi:hypothetical protein BDW72DRAFT_186507 [Aspergillus terricola var. indicus]
MKLLFVSILLAALLATAVQAAPAAESQRRWCRFPGEICAKTKRTADALNIVKREADAVAEPFKINRWCRFPGQVCGKAKRAAEALEDVKRSAEAVADAMAFLDELTREEYTQLAKDFGQLKEESDNSKE